MSIPIARASAALCVAGLLAGTLAGCGGGSTATRTSAPAAGATGAPSAGGPGERRRQFDPAMQQEIAQCLQAAGLPVPSFSPRPSGPRPSGPRPSGPRPSGSFTGPRPSGPPGVRGPYADPKVRAALEACGIELPAGPPGTPPAG